MPEAGPLEQIALAETGRTTTRLGFGCSGLMGGLSERESLRLLGAAYDAGIRHFDVAPSYGHGMAERCLGKFLRGRQTQVTVTTKYGILPPSHRGLLDAARRVVRPIAQQFPAVRRRTVRAASTLQRRADFSAQGARASLERSLRELGLERVDLWLLHEATVDDLADNALLDFLQEQVRQGRIGGFGVGSGAEKLPAIWEQRRAYCPVLQTEWPGFDWDATAYSGAFLVHHRVVQRHLAGLSAILEQDPDRQRRWSSAVDLDLRDRSVLAALLLHTALYLRPEGMVLFSSRSLGHLRADLQTPVGAAWGQRVRTFSRLVREDRTAR
jgi:diketogulonate reductase-like aldo/keto reductase